MKKIRQLHNYLGTFFAPAILFFAFSGAMQTFGLHESEAGEEYQAPVWIKTMAEVHKDQRLVKPPKHHDQHPTDADSPSEHTHASGKQDGKEAEQPNAQAQPEIEPKSTLPMKIFVLLLAVGLMSSSLLGIFMAYQNRNNRRVTSALLLLGMLLPIALLKI